MVIIMHGYVLINTAERPYSLKALQEILYAVSLKTAIDYYNTTVEEYSKYTNRYYKNWFLRNFTSKKSIIEFYVKTIYPTIDAPAVCDILYNLIKVLEISAPQIFIPASHIILINHYYSFCKNIPDYKKTIDTAELPDIMEAITSLLPIKDNYELNGVVPKRI